MPWRGETEHLELNTVLWMECKNAVKMQKESKQAITDSGGEEGGGEAVNGLFGQHKVFLLDICKGTS